MVKSLKAQLDGILIFAGLFAGVNSAFLVLTLPEMCADPADDTNALLLQLVTRGNGSIHSAADLPSASFSPPPAIFPVNILFSLSLTLALLASFLAVLGRQWLVYYRKRSGGGPEAQRWEQLRRHLGAKRWHLEAVLDDVLPSLLQLGLVIFCISFVLYPGTLTRPMCYTVAAPVGLAFVCILVISICVALDNWCPFKSPLSHLLKSTPRPLVHPAWRSSLHLLCWTLAAFSKTRLLIIPTTDRIKQVAWHGISSCLTGTRTALLIVRTFLSNAIQAENETSLESAGGVISWLTHNIPRLPEPRDQLKLIAAKRVLCTSEDSNALVYAAVNLRAITSREGSQWLLGDDEVYHRLRELPHGPSYGRPPPTIQEVAFTSTFFHLALSAQSPHFFLPPNHRLLLSSDSADSNVDTSALGGELRKFTQELLRSMDVSSATFGPQSCPDCDRCILLSFCTDLIRYTTEYWPIRDGLWGWFEIFAVVQKRLTKGNPIVARILVIAARLYSDEHPIFGGLQSRSDLNSPEQSEWRYHVFSHLSRLNHDCNIETVLHIILDAFDAVGSRIDYSAGPDDLISVMLMEQACGLLEIHRASTWSFHGRVAKNTIALFQKIVRPEYQRRVVWVAANRTFTRCLDVLVNTFACNKFFTSEMIELRHQEGSISKELEAGLRSAEESIISRSGTIDATLFLKLLEIWDLIQNCAPIWDTDDRAYDQLETCFTRLKEAIIAAQRRSNADVKPVDPSPVLVAHRAWGLEGTPESEENPPDRDALTLVCYGNTGSYVNSCAASSDQTT
ncbi:hypothetical protein FS837_003503 [Tulasnella sp. UAMH 9824]|nr:hypothetical protein FS837_003503 [Tulasnella sp. UAMH 9824]